MTNLINKISLKTGRILGLIQFLFKLKPGQRVSNPPPLSSGPSGAVNLFINVVLSPCVLFTCTINEWHTQTHRRKHTLRNEAVLAATLVHSNAKAKAKETKRHNLNSRSLMRNKNIKLAIIINDS